MRLHIGPLEKRLTHMPFTHALTGSNPVRVTTYATYAKARLDMSIHTQKSTHSSTG